VVEPPVERVVGQRPILVDTPHEILVNKLCALYSRWAIRDLVDGRALVLAGEDLDRALRDAPRKDSGFSPVTLAWVLRQLDVRTVARQAGFDPEALEPFRDELVARLLE